MKLDETVKDFFGPKKTLLQEMVEGELSNTIKEIQAGVVDEQVPLVVELGMAREGKLNESWLHMFGGWVETILGKMFGMNSIPVTIKGTRSQVDSFAKTISGEKRYIDAWRQYGLDDARTHGSKAQLDNAIRGFESKTGIKYPFK